MTTPAYFHRFVLIGLLGAGAWARGQGQDPAPSGELSDETRQIRSELKDVGLRLERLAKGLAEKEPEDAQRMLDAVNKIHRADLGRVLDDISALLLKSSFVEALGRQERALEEIDAIIAILEKARFETPEDLDKKSQEVKELLQATAELAKKQDTLLEKTRKVLDLQGAMEALKDLQREISQIKETQSGLNDGKDPEKLDPAAQKADENALQQALDSASRLRAQQEKIDLERGQLPPERLPIGELKELVQKLDELIEEGKQLAADTTKVGDEAAALKQLAAGKPTESDQDKAKARGSDSGNDAGKQAEPQDSPRPGTEGPSPLEIARRGEAASEKQAELSQAAKEFAEKLSSLAQAAGKENAVPRDAKSASAAAAEKAESAARQIAAEEAKSDPAQANLEPAAKSESGAMEDLQRARDVAAKELADLEQKNNAASAGLTQEQGMLEQKTSEASQETSSSAAKASSEAAKSALQQGATAMEEAAKAMSEAAQAESNGDRQKAQAAGQKAQEKLQSAEAELAKGQKSVAERTAAQKAAELQKKIAKKVAETRERTAELQKKLKKKDNEKAGASLEKSQDALSKASQAMQDAASAQEKGDNQLSKKKGEEALAELASAEEALAAEEKDQLERLEKEKAKLRETKSEQEELARLTKDLAKKSKAASQDSSASESAEGLEQASGDMEQAAEELDQNAPEEAKKEQEEALAKLKQARQELEEEEEKLAQLKREQEMLNLIQALSTLKEAEEKVLADTVKANSGREANESRRQRARVTQAVEPISKRQDELATEVDELNGKLKAELARVFTFVLKNVSSDMRQARDLLKELDTGSYTQFLQKEISSDLERLLVALKEELEKPEPEPSSEQGQQPSGEKQPRLLPPVAEIRMLRDMQVAVNKGTRDLEDIRKASLDGVSDSWKKALDRLLQKQGSVSGMTIEIMKDSQKQEASDAEADSEENTENQGNDHGHDH